MSHNTAPNNLTMIPCDACNGLMSYTSGNHLRCSCGNTWDAPWDGLLDLDKYLCEASLNDGDAVNDLIIMATADADPDDTPIQHALDAFGLPFYVSDRMVIAWAHWQRDIYREEGAYL